jgi:hypothetical protein
VGFRKDRLLSTVPRYFQATVAAMFLTSCSMAGELPGVAINSDRTAVEVVGKERPRHDLGELESLNHPAVIQEVRHILLEHIHR